ncbi:hypothetical protein FD12_GL000097 [Lentilactobacillus rapi DSM 19907 = JCM 15042]|uniref:Fucose-binding lectin II n=2 Tax=Lentilactobacillus rapi TaxID=481723 RepID=A0A512PQE4_9LACO|nr:fucose-binding lectin II [Lentilactobacillus rapi]KRL16364.1 hypothetical protein FD12_GL000097 [Lentilactobacillus rapi DSM 19907 = JCM 15042]GEP73445.1 hypothetical protein LRA02_23130 [Lentilactobacillus rapi]
MKLTSKLLLASASALLTFGAVSPAVTAGAASVKTASRSYQNTKIKASYRYAKKMLVKNKTGLSGKTAYIFSKKAYPTTGAAGGYADFLLSLKGWGYKFTTNQKKRVASSLVLNSKSTPADLANAIQGLKSIGMNPTKFRRSGTKKAVNLVSVLYRKSMSNQTVNVKSQVLLALTMSSSFKRPSTAKFSINSLSNSIVKNQLSNNGWAYNNKLDTVDSDTTAMAVTALARGKASASASAITKGQSYLKSAVYPSGAYGYTFNGKSIPNGNSTAEAIIALSTKQNTLKYVNGTSKSSQTASPLYAMFTYVNKTGSVKGAASQLIGIGQVNLATAAYRQALNHKSVYTIK